MSRIAMAALAVTALGAFAGPVPPRQRLLVVRLSQDISTHAAHAGDPVRGVVVSSATEGRTVLIPLNSVVLGRVLAVHRVGAGFVHERASLKLEFRQWRSVDGTLHPLSARVVDVDNARERVSPSGRITGILAAGGPPGFLLGMWQRPTDELWSRTALGMAGISGFLGQRFNMDPIGIAGLAALRMAVVPPAEPEIWFPAGTDLVLSVNADMPATSVCSPEEPVPPEIRSWAAALPLRTSRASRSERADVTNVAFLGSREQLMNAFNAAGWREAEPLTRQSFVRLYRAMSAQRGYATAPMSKLMLEDKAPDLEFEKSFNTVARRHHVRIWQEGTLDGREVWVGAGTHDTAVHLGAHGFTHSIDARVDQERQRIVDDLSFAGCVERAQFVDRPDASTAAGDDILTDGRLAVLTVNKCERPVSASAEGPRESGPVRLLRRIVLEARYAVLRGNVYYWGFRTAQGLWTARHGRDEWGRREQGPVNACVVPAGAADESASRRGAAGILADVAAFMRP